MALKLLLSCSETFFLFGESRFLDIEPIPDEVNCLDPDSILLMFRRDLLLVLPSPVSGHE